MKNSLTIGITGYNRKEIFHAIDSALKIEHAKIIVCFDILNSELYSQVRNSYSGVSNVHIFEKKNGGLSSSRNFILDMTETDYLFFLDDDDQITDEFARFVSNSQLGGFIYRFSKNVIQDGSLKAYDKIPKRITKNNMFQCLQVSTYLLGKNVYKKIKFHENILSEDIVFAQDVFKLNTEQQCIDIPSINYVKFNSDSITKNITEAEYLETIDFSIQNKYLASAFVSMWIAYSYTKKMSRKTVKSLIKNKLNGMKNETFKQLPLIYKLRFIWLIL